MAMIADIKTYEAEIADLEYLQARAEAKKTRAAQEDFIEAVHKFLMKLPEGLRKYFSGRLG
ncbi:MAG: hypothetical protein PHO00_00965 [bacterium]|nr:hypothetical protein [bacterium]